MTEKDNKELDEITLFPSSGTTVYELSDSIIAYILEGVTVKLHSAGKWAVHQMNKSLARASNALAGKGIDIVWRTSFITKKGFREGDNIVVLETSVFIVKPDGTLSDKLSKIERGVKNAVST